MQIIPSAGIADVIAYAWYQIGYRPKDSLVVVGIRIGAGGRQACGAVVRLDVPPPAQMRREVDGICRILRDAGHFGFIGLIDASTRVPGTDPINRRGLAKSLRAAGRRNDLMPFDIFGLSAERYSSYFCDDELCCAPGGNPLTSVVSSAAAAALVVQGCTLAQDEQALIAHALPSDQPLITAQALESVPIPEAEDVLEVWCRVAEPGAADADSPLPADDLVTLCRGLSDVVIRDALLAAVTGPGDDSGLDRARMVIAGQGEQLFHRLDGEPPNRALVRCANHVLSQVARHAPPGHRAEALAMLAWISWCSGSGVRGRLYAERALADVADHRLADLVLQVLQSGCPPQWFRQREPGESLDDGSVADYRVPRS